MRGRANLTRNADPSYADTFCTRLRRADTPQHSAVALPCPQWHGVRATRRGWRACHAPPTRYADTFSSLSPLPLLPTPLTAPCRRGNCAGSVTPLRCRPPLPAPCRRGTCAGSVTPLRCRPPPCRLQAAGEVTVGCMVWIMWAWLGFGMW